MKTSTLIYLFILFYLFIYLFCKGFVFMVVPLLMMLPCDNLRFVCLSICMGYKSHKNWSIVTKFRYVCEANSLNSSTKNCNHMLDIFYGTTSKSWLHCWALVFIKGNRQLQKFKAILREIILVHVIRIFIACNHFLQERIKRFESNIGFEFT